ncbi:MAG: UDP-N-acetylglucosamine transferase subunit ALG14 [Endomicrobiales bacterium]|nr:UDP-N-acetylglucosamine transferase subunit ALG14 [Endomicrobiales bacterium]
MSKNVLMVCARGGHFTELIELVDVFNGFDKTLVTYRDDYVLESECFNKVYLVPNPLGGVFNMGIFLLNTIKIIFRTRPAVVFSTGAEIAIPFFLLCKLFYHSQLIYVECSAQVFNPSGTGKLVYPIADLFIVQWKTLLGKYGKKAKYVGGLL